MTSYLQNWKSYQTQILHQECFYGHNDSCQVLFQLLDVNLDFWHIFGICASEPLWRGGGTGWRTTEKAGPDSVNCFKASEVINLLDIIWLPIFKPQNLNRSYNFPSSLHINLSTKDL